MDENNLNVVAKKRNPKTMWALITIITLFAFLLIVTLMYFNSPRRKFISNFTKFYNELVEKNSSNKMNNILKNDIVGINGKTSISLDIDEKLLEEDQEMLNIVKKLGKIDLNYNYKENKKDKKSSLSFDSKISNEDFIKLEAAMKDNKIYFNLKNLIDKYYYTDYEFISLLDVTNMEDTEYVLDIIKDVIVEKVTSDYFKSEKTTIKINNKDEKVEKISLEINYNLIKDILTTVIDELKNDEKAMNILVEYNKMEKEEIIKQFDEAKESLNTSSSDEKCIYNMYVKGSKTLRHEFVVDITSIEYTTYDNVDEIKVLDNSVEQLSITFKHENDKTVINGNISSLLTLSGSYSNGKLDLSLNVMGTEMAKLNVTTTENVNSDKIDTTFNATLVISENETEMLNININSKNTVSKETAIDDKNTSNSVHVDDITEKDQQTMMNNLMELPIISDIIDMNMNLNTSMNTMQSIDEY